MSLGALNTKSLQWVGERNRLDLRSESIKTGWNPTNSDRTNSVRANFEKGDHGIDFLFPKISFFESPTL
jgi:hypothetical protein